MCSSWKVLQKDKKEKRQLTNLIAELQQAVLAEGNKLCSSSITSQTGASASNDTQLSEAPLASGAASSAEQSAAATTYTESNVEQPAESIARSIVEQPAQTFASIEALNLQLRAQSDASSGADVQRLRAAVMIFNKQTETAIRRHHTTVLFVEGALERQEPESTIDDLDR